MIPNFLDKVTSDVHLILDNSKIREEGTFLKINFKDRSYQLTDVSLAAIRLVGTAVMGVGALITISAIPYVLFVGEALRLVLGIMTFAVGHDVFVASHNISKMELAVPEGRNQQETLAKGWSQGLLLKPILEPFVHRFLKTRSDLSAELA